VDTLKSLVMIALLGSILYGVYTVASKPDQPLPPEIAAHATQLESVPVIETGRPAPSAPLLTPPQITPANPLASESHTVPAPPASFPASPSVSSTPPAPARHDHLVQPATNTEASEERLVESPTAEGKFSNQLRNPAVPAPVTGSAGSSALPNAPATALEPVESSRVVGASYSRVESPSAEEIEASQSRVRLYAFRQAWKAAQDQVKDGGHREALLTLSAFYGDPVIPADEHAALMEWLDALAARVVYSTQHYLAPEYVVRRGETLYAVAEQYHVPYLLLKNINGVRDPEMLLPGTRLKVVPGPFRAEVSLSRNELTLFVGGLYAGRFNVQMGLTPVRPGEYTVKEKNNRKAYHGASGTVAPEDPRNPFGGIWIDLGEQVAIHGSAAEAYVNRQDLSLSLAPRDAEDVYGILSLGSRVIVKE
jgi:LysM repeat protein